MCLTPKNCPETYKFHYREMEEQRLIFEGISSQDDSIKIKTRSKSLMDYPLTATGI